MILSYKIIKKGLFIIGLIIGAIHFKTGLKAMFVMTDEDHLSILIIILLGPMLTLPAVIISYFKPKPGGISLIIGSVISLMLMILLAVDAVYLGKVSFYVIRYFIPMTMLGCSSLFLNKIERE